MWELEGEVVEGGEDDDAIEDVGWGYLGVGMLEGCGGWGKMGWDGSVYCGVMDEDV